MALENLIDVWKIVKRNRRFRRIGIVLGSLIILFLLFLFLPVVRFDKPLSLVVLDRNGELLSASIADDEQWRFPTMERIPEKFISAVTCYEDRRFFHHPGVDIFSIARAIRNNLKTQGIVSGASTITMQVVRLSRPGRPRNLWEKCIEILLALRLEFARTKEEILILYVSHAPFGGNVVGLEAASWRYFGRRPETLSWAETAMLAVLPNTPSLIHPGRNRDLLLSKRNSLLQKMSTFGIIDSLTCTLAEDEPLPEKPCILPALTPHLHQRLKSILTKSPSGFSETRSRTTLVKSLQIQASQVVERHHRRLAVNGIQNAAALILDVVTGNVLAYIGNIQEITGDHGQYVDIILSPRSTGSLLKPFLYAGMLEDGEILPTSLIPDIPMRLGGFQPQNYSRTYQGAVPATRALARSLNVPSVRMLHLYGVDRFYRLLKSMGMNTLFRPASEYGLTLILGGAEGMLWEMTGMYAGMARCVNQYFQDTKIQPAIYPNYLIVSNNKHSKIVRQYFPDAFPLSPGSCWLTLQAMLDVVRPEEEMEWRNYASSQKIAWKTGTSYGFRDGWAIGVTPKYAIGVWTGNADGEGRPGLTGLTTAAPIMFDLFDVVKPAEWFDYPENALIPIDVCARSGYRAGIHCTVTKEILSPLVGWDTSPCPFCRTIHCDTTLTWRVHSDCESVAAMQSVSWFVLPPAMEWFYRQTHPDYRPLPPYRPDCRLSAQESSNVTMTLLRIDGQQTNTFYIPTELSGEQGKVVFEVTHRDPDCILFWHLNDEYITSTQGIHQIALSPESNMHRITVVDENGVSISQEFIIAKSKSTKSVGNDIEK